MRARLAAVVAAGILVLVASPVAAQVAVRAADLLEAPQDYDGMVVVVEGELVGDYGYRSDGTVWTQLNDDPYARAPIAAGGPPAGGNVGVGVRIPRALVDELDPPGGYRRRGPLVRVEGIWRYHDPATGGNTYLDVLSLTVVEPGLELEEGPDWFGIVVGGALLGLAAAAWMSYRSIRDRF